MSLAGNSLISGNLQGIVRFSATIESFVALENAGFPLVSTTISLRAEQGIISNRTGKQQAGNGRETGFEAPGTPKCGVSVIDP